MKLMSDSISQIAAALVLAQKGMGAALKDAKNPFFKSSYADLNSIREAVLPACNENGITVLQPTVYIEGKKFVQTMLLHTSGEYISGLTEILTVKELDAQAQGSGISYARRYGLQSLANVGSEDDDGNSASGKSAAAPIRATSGYSSVAISASPVNATATITTTASSGKNHTTITVPAPVEGKRSFRTTKPQTVSEDL